MQIRQMPEMAESIVMTCVLPAPPPAVKHDLRRNGLDAVQHGRQSDASFSGLLLAASKFRLPTHPVYASLNQ
jgi:hypothetical protein